VARRSRRGDGGDTHQAAIVHSFKETTGYIKIDQFLARLPQLKSFLHKMGRETRQGEVVFEFDGRFLHP
jgi:hypothetical protein